MNFSGIFFNVNIVHTQLWINAFHVYIVPSKGLFVFLTNLDKFLTMEVIKASIDIQYQHEYCYQLNLQVYGHYLTPPMDHLRLIY